jgi:hypothetical protein
MQAVWSVIVVHLFGRQALIGAEVSQAQRESASQAYSPLMALHGDSVHTWFGASQ